MRIMGERRAANGQASLDPDCAATAQTSARYRLVVGELRAVADRHRGIKRVDRAATDAVCACLAGGRVVGEHHVGTGNGQRAIVSVDCAATTGMVAIAGRRVAGESTAIDGRRGVVGVDCAAIAIGGGVAGESTAIDGQRAAIGVNQTTVAGRRIVTEGAAIDSERAPLADIGHGEAVMVCEITGDSQRGLIVLQGEQRICRNAAFRATQRGIASVRHTDSGIRLVRNRDVALIERRRRLIVAAQFDDRRHAGQSLSYSIAQRLKIAVTDNNMPFDGLSRLRRNRVIRICRGGRCHTSRKGCRDAHDRQPTQRDAADKGPYASCQTLHRFLSLHIGSFVPDYDPINL